jgi:hypothetical protein
MKAKDMRNGVLNAKESCTCKKAGNAGVDLNISEKKNLLKYNQ